MRAAEEGGSHALVLSPWHRLGSAASPPVGAVVRLADRGVRRYMEPRSFAGLEAAFILLRRLDGQRS